MKRAAAKWVTKIVLPIGVNVATAAILFMLALIFKPAIQYLLAPPKIDLYPLVCFAEPHAGETPAQRHVDFYIVNLRDRDFKRDELVDLLRPFSPEPDRPLSPDLRLTMRQPGRVVRVTRDDEFNRDKGEIKAAMTPDHGTTTIQVLSIASRAFLRILIEYDGMMEVTGVSRMARVLIPFDFAALQERCFQTSA